MFPPPFGLFEVGKELILSYPPEFHHAICCVAPKGVIAIDMVLATSKFLLMVVHTLMGIATGEKTLLRFPSVSVNITRFQDMSLEDRLTKTRSPRLWSPRTGVLPHAPRPCLRN